MPVRFAGNRLRGLLSDTSFVRRSLRRFGTRRCWVGDAARRFHLSPPITTRRERRRQLFVRRLIAIQ